ncbi:MAG TPA: CaiB/BaiF CoA-transferase family protein [Pseudonocardia sp.]|jgi:alpha-methylacyl-CoA racemase|nr:CaiB/BaiF CoA-transferase family protein [Pseudonocardia sp.]
MGPLNGVKVVELASLAPAPFGCMVLADLGADVLQIRRGSPGEGLSAPAGPLDRGKRTLALDLKSERDLEVAHEIIAAADVFVEGFRPGVTERLGLGPDVLLARNPRLVYARMTGWGQHGELAARAGHDINYIALAGALEPIGRAGERPVPPLNLIGDFAGGGMLLALGVIAALYERERSGAGQVVDAAMVDGAALLTAFLHGMHASGLWNEERGTNALDGGAPFYDTYECADGRYVAVGCVEPQFFAQLVAGLGIDAELPFHLDPRGWPEIRERLRAAFEQRPRDEWAKLFADTDACVTPVLSPWEAAEHPHNQERELFVEVDGVRQPAPAPRFSRTPAELPRPSEPAPGGAADVLTRWGNGHAS